MRATLLFCDIRDFSGFAARASPEETARLAAGIAQIAMQAVPAHGGDADRLPGDGLTARFDGEDRRARRGRRRRHRARDRGGGIAARRRRLGP